MRARHNSETSRRAALVAAASLALCRVAAAEPEKVIIDYAAPVGCPDARVFLDSLRARTTQFRNAPQGEPARRFLVQVTPQGSSYAGRLEIRSPDGSVAVRRVDASACEEVMEALALMTALAIDPNALAGSTKPVEPTPEPPSEAKPPRSSATTAVVALRPASSAPSSLRPWRWSAGVLGHVTVQLSPTLGYGGDLFVDAEAPRSSGAVPAARMGIFVNQSSIQLPTGAAARFRWAAMSAEGCPVRLGLEPLRLVVQPCLGLRLGVLYGEGLRISQPEQRASFWSDAGPVLRLRVAVSDRVFLEAQAALMLPLHRPTFEILEMGSPTRAYAVPPLGGLAALGVGYRLR